MDLTLHGRTLDDTDLKPRLNYAEQLRAYLDSLPDGYLVNSSDIAEALDTTTMAVSGASHSAVAYFIQGKAKNRFWGNPRTIAEARKRQKALATPKEPIDASPTTRRRSTLR